MRRIWRRGGATHSLPGPGHGRGNNRRMAVWHLGQKQCKSKAETKLVLAMLRRSLRSLESKLKPIGLIRLSVCTVFRVSNPVTNRRLRLSSNSTLLRSRSLSASCILLTLTRRLRVISNAYFDTPSIRPEAVWASCYLVPSWHRYSRWREAPRADAPCR